MSTKDNGTYPDAFGESIGKVEDEVKDEKRA